MKYTKLKVSNLRLPDSREREVNDAKVDELVVSIKAMGLINPIIVSQDRKTIVAGAHRWSACVKLELDEIDCRIITDERDAKLIEIEENLIRKELSASERKEHIQKRYNIIVSRIDESTFNDVIDAKVKSKNLSQKDAPTVKSIVEGNLTTDNVKPKVLEAVTAIQNEVRKRAESVLSDGMGVSRRYIRNAVKTETAETPTSDVPKISFDKQEIELQVEKEVLRVHSLAKSRLRKVTNEITAELTQLNELKGVKKDNTVTEKVRELLKSIEELIK
ncbi:ParB N-terminal domain-containing protein [Vibrio cyclitrophicus]